MKLSPVVSLIIFGVGVLLLVWGFNAGESFASNGSETERGSHSIKSILLIVLGALAALVGLIAAIRRT